MPLRMSIWRSQLVKKGFDKLVDGEASSPARCRASNLRFEPSAVSPRAKPENPKGFQPLYHPLQSPLKIEDFSGAEPARKRFLLWKMGFSGAKIAPCPPYMPLGAIESSRGLRPSRALRGFFDSLGSPERGAVAESDRGVRRAYLRAAADFLGGCDKAPRRV